MEKNGFKLNFQTMRNLLCSFAIMLVTVIVPKCRSESYLQKGNVEKIWYQPKEPVNFSKILK